jgi:gliding motility-associated-like protein
MYHKIKLHIALFVLLVFSFVGNINAQCPQLYDFFGTPNNAPYWYDCTGNNYTLTIQSPNNIGSYTIDWGDGSPNSTGGSLIPPASVTHTYNSAVDTFIVTFTEDTSGCVIQGVMVMEEATSASIQIPIGGLTQTCAPAPLEFINSSTNTSETTVFTWDFGDGSPPVVYDYTNVGQTISHTYQQGTVNCVTQVTLTAENYCNTIQGGNSMATFNPIRIWDIDDAAINASATVLCYPDTIVTFQNITNRNCLAQGNIAQRYEWWNFGDYWGNGYDSIVGWVAWPPANPYTMAYPGIGSYDVMMVDSSFCGLDTAFITIQIVPPPFAALNANKDTICEGESITFSNLSGGGANAFFWNFGDGGGWVPSAGGAVNHTYNNAGDFTIQVVSNITGGTGGCTDTASLDIHVLATPLASFSFDNNNGCDSMNVNFTNTSSIDAITWVWDFDNGQTDNTSTPSIQFYGAAGNYNIDLTVTNANGCPNTFNQTLTVYQSPVPAFTPTSVCVNEMASFLDNSTFLGTDSILTWSWDFGDGATSIQQNPFHMYTAPGFYNMVLTVNTAFCVGADTVQINVENIPTANFVPDTTSGCADLLVNFNNTSSANATNFYWDFGDGDTSIAINPSHLFLNSFGYDTTYTVTLIAQTTFGCSDTVTQQVTVFPNPSASFVDNASLDCAPLIVNFTNTSSGGVAYEWDFNDGSPIDTAFSPNHTYQNLTQFIDNNLLTLIVTSANGCTDTVQKNIVVYPEPQFGFSINPDSGCSPLLVTFPSVIGAVDYQWDFGDGTFGSGPTPNHIYYNTVTNNIVYNVTLTATSPFACVDTTYGSVLVFPNPSAQFTIDSLNGCHPLEVNYTNSSTGGTFYHWNLGDGTIFDTLSSNFQHTYTNTTGATVQMQVELIAETDRSCKDTITQLVDVYPKVTAVLQADTVGCSPFTTTFNNFSSGATKYYWDFGDGSAIDTTFNPTHQFINSGFTNVTYTVSLVIESVYGCLDTTYQDVIVYPATTALLATNDTIGCHPLTINFTNNSIGGTFYHWNLDDGSSFDTTSLNFNHTFLNTSGVIQNYNVSLVSETNNGCKDTTFQNILVYPDVTAILQADTFGCSPFTTTFNNFSIGATKYYWDFGDGSAIDTTSSPTHQFVNPSLVNTFYTVTLISESVYGCTDTVYQQILVYPATTAQLSVDNIIGCHPLTVGFVNNSIGGTSYHWDFGDGISFDTSALGFNHTFYNTTGVIQNFQTTLISETINGCKDTAYQSIDVYPDVVAIFVADTSGCSPLNSNLVNNSIGASTYVWNFGDGSPVDTSFSPTHQYTNTTPNDVTYAISLISESVYGCLDTMIQDITIYTTPQASFTPTPLIQTYPSTAIAISNTTSAGGWQYHWYYGDGDSSLLSIPPNHVYSTWGNYTVSVLVEGAYCSDTASSIIQIIPPVPVVNFTGPAQGCRPLTVSFQNNSIYGYSNAWNFGDGGISTQENPTYTYYNAGIYSVTLTVVGDGGQDTETQTQIIEVYENPNAVFTVSPSVVFIPDEPVLLFNLSNFASSYSWDFGDGGTSTDQNPQHFYTQPGFYDIQLVASTENNCTDTFRIISAVEAKAEGGIKIPNAFTPNIGGSNGGEVIPGNLDNDVFHPILYGVDKYELNIFNKWGELLFISTDIKIGWDGYYRDELCQQDVYVYKIQVTYIDGTSDSFVGDLTLLR